MKNLPSIWETQIRSLCREDPLEKGMATHSSVLAWPATVHGVAESQTRLSNQLNAFIHRDYMYVLLLLLLSRFSCVRLCVTP